MPERLSVSEHSVIDPFDRQVLAEVGLDEGDWWLDSHDAAPVYTDKLARVIEDLERQS